MSLVAWGSLRLRFSSSLRFALGHAWFFLVMCARPRCIARRWCGRVRVAHTRSRHNTGARSCNNKNDKIVERLARALLDKCAQIVRVSGNRDGAVRRPDRPTAVCSLAVRPPTRPRARADVPNNFARRLRVLLRRYRSFDKTTEIRRKHARASDVCAQTSNESNDKALARVVANV